MRDLITVGHLTFDYVTRRGISRPRWRLGGPPAYCSVAALALGASVSAISKVGPDFGEKSLARLQRIGLNLAGVEVVDAPTTRFRIEYLNEERRLRLESKCEPIHPENVRAAGEARVFHIAPVIDEVPTETALAAARKARLASLDPQGYTRAMARDGSVRSRKWLDRSLLKRIDVYKSSGRELQAITRASSAGRGLRKICTTGPEIAMATLGSRGVIMCIRKGKIWSMPASGPARVTDPTGAGDAYIGAFLPEYVRSEDALWAAALGLAASSLVIETAGPTMPRGKKMQERARWSHERARLVSNL